MKYFSIALIAILGLIFISAMLIDNPSTDTEEVLAEKLDEIWYQGKAEVNTYTLKQNRYKDLHDGEAVMIFVTEDFLTDKQVKNDNYTNPNSVGVLKNNQIRRFTTGLYDYHMFTSVFNKVGDDKPLKVTTSSQDWCGQTYMQLNKDNLNIRYNSILILSQKEIESFKVDDVIVEDALFNMIRMNPKSLPLGDFKILPSTITARLKHLDYEPLDAHGILLDGTETTQIYYLQIPEQAKKLRIEFEVKSPHKILKWEEELPSAFDNKPRTTVATLKESKWIDYWTKNSASDKKLRAEFKVDGFQ